MLVARKNASLSYENDTYKKTKVKKRRRISKTNQIVHKVKFITFSIALMGACITLLLMYAKTSSMKYDILRLDKEIIELEEQKQALEIQLEKIKESGVIENIAISELGMQYPTNNQIVYLNTQGSNSQISTAKKKDSKNENFYKGLINSITSFLHLFI